MENLKVSREVEVKFPIGADINECNSIALDHYGIKIHNVHYLASSDIKSILESLEKDGDGEFDEVLRALGITGLSPHTVENAVNCLTEGFPAHGFLLNFGHALTYTNHWVYEEDMQSAIQAGLDWANENDLDCWPLEDEDENVDINFTNVHLRGVKALELHDDGSMEEFEIYCAHIYSPELLSDGPVKLSLQKAVNGMVIIPFDDWMIPHTSMASINDANVREYLVKNSKVFYGDDANE